MVSVVWIGGFGRALDPLLQRRYTGPLENYLLHRHTRNIPLSKTSGRRRFREACLVEVSSP